MKNEYSENMSKLADVKLKEIVDNPQNYDQNAVLAATNEIMYREMNPITESNEDKDENSKEELKTYSHAMNYWSYLFLISTILSFFVFLYTYSDSHNYLLLISSVSNLFMYCICKFMYNLGKEVNK